MCVCDWSKTKEDNHYVKTVSTVSTDWLQRCCALFAFKEKCRQISILHPHVILKNSRNRPSSSEFCQNCEIGTFTISSVQFCQKSMYQAASGTLILCPRHNIFSMLLLLPLFYSHYVMTTRMFSVSMKTCRPIFICVLYVYFITLFMIVLTHAHTQILQPAANCLFCVSGFFVWASVYGSVFLSTKLLMLN